MGIEDLPKYFQDRVDFDIRHGGYVWVGARQPVGYGFTFRKENGRRVTKMAHRVIYEMLVGPIAPGLQLHHDCGLKHCVDPKHIRSLPRSEHSSITGKAKMTHCRYGHSLAGENLYVNRGVRACRQCRNEHALAYYYDVVSKKTSEAPCPA